MKNERGSILEGLGCTAGVIIGVLIIVLLLVGLLSLKLD